MVKLPNLLVALWTHVAHCRCAFCSAVVRRSTSIALTGDWLDVPLTVAAGVVFHSKTVDGQLPSRGSGGEHQIFPDSHGLTTNYRRKAKQYQLEARKFLEDVAAGKESLVRWNHPAADLSLLEQPKCIAIKLHWPAALIELQGSNEDRAQQLAEGAWEWIASEIATGSQVAGISTRMLGDYAELVATGDLEQSTPLTAELAKLSTMGLGSELAAGLREKFPDVWAAISTAIGGERIGVGKHDAFVPASTLWRERFDTYRKFKAWMKQHPEIRTASPRPNRLTIHAADWARHWGAASTNEFNADPDKVKASYLAEVEARKAEVRKKKQAGY